MGVATAPGIEDSVMAMRLTRQAVCTPAGRVYANGGVDERGVLDVGDRALPDVEIGEIGAVAGGQGRAGLVRLAGEGDGVAGPRGASVVGGGCGVFDRSSSPGSQTADLCRAVVLDQDAVEVHAAETDVDRVGRAGG